MRRLPGQPADWNTEAGLGREKIFEVRRIHNDLTFIDEFLTLDFCPRAQAVFVRLQRPASEAYEIESREFPKVKQQLLFKPDQSAAGRSSASPTATTRIAASCS